MRVTAAIATDEVGGAERYLQLLADELGRRDHELTVVGRLPNVGPATARVPVPVGPKWSRRTLWRSLRAARSERARYLAAIAGTAPDVIHLQFKREQILVTRAASTLAPVVWTEHGVWPGGPYGRALGVAYRRASAHVSSIVCVSHAVERSLRDDVGVDASKLVVIDNPVDLTTFHPGGEGRDAVRAELGVPTDAVVLVTTSRLEHAKGIDRVVAAMAHLPDRFRLLVVGDGSRRAELAAAARELGERVVLTGFRHDVAELLRAADVFVLPSRAEAREGQPLSVLQALATGLPTVLTRDAGVTDLVPSGAAVVAGPSPEELADAARAAWDRSEALGAAALAAAGSHAVDRWADRHLGVLASAAALADD